MFLQSHGTWRFRRLMFRARCRPGRPALGPARRRSRGPEPCHLLGLAGRALQASRRDRFSSSGAPTLSLPSSSGAPNIQCFLGSACLPCSRPLQVSKIRHLPPEGIGRRRHCGKQVVDKYLNPFSSLTDGRDSTDLLAFPAPIPTKQKENPSDPGAGLPPPQHRPPKGKSPSHWQEWGWPFLPWPGHQGSYHPQA